MVSYFKINDPYRLLTLFLFVTLIRLAFMFLGVEQLEVLSDNSFDPDSSGQGPLYTWLSLFVTSIFPKPLIPSLILSGLLVTLQAFSINSILINNKAFDQSSYLPAAIYVLAISASPEFLLTSPAMVSVTFILIVVNYMLFHLQYRGSEENILSTGFVLGVAILFHPPCVVFVLLVYGLYLIYSNTLNRRYLLIFFGILLPMLMIWIYYLWIDKGIVFWNDFAQNIFSATRDIEIPGNQLTLFLGFPVLLSLISASASFTGIGMTNHQIIIQRTFLVLGFFALGSVFINHRINTNSLVYMAPVIAFFISQLISDMQRKWLAELTFLVLIIWSLSFLFLPVLAPEVALVEFAK